MVLMRESARTERMHLPQDTYQEWLKSQKEKPSPKGRGKEVTANSFELWVTKRVKRRIVKASGRTRPKGAAA